MSSNASDQSGGSNQSSSFSFNGPMVLIAFASLVFVVMIIVALHLYARYILRRGGAPRPRITTISIVVHGGDEAAGRERRWAGLEPDSIAALPTFEYKREGSGNNSSKEAGGGEDCAVCISVLEEGEMVRMLPNCKHVFHVPCIDKWLLEHTTCPVCRSAVEPAVKAEVGEASGPPPPPPPPPPPGELGSKEVGSTSALGSSFRRMLSWEWSGRRVQGDGVDDLERR